METRWAKRLVVVVLIALLPACRLVVEVPAGGSVVSQSGAYQCGPGSTCTLEVVDQNFSEVFAARPAGNNAFLGWAAGAGALCANRQGNCALSTRGFADNASLLAILESGRSFYLRPVFLENPRLVRDDLSVEGSETPIPGGINIQGSFRLSPAATPEQALTDSDVDIRFDSEGEVLSLFGGTVLPRQLTDYIGVIGTSRAQVGLYSGAQLNADEDINIRLIDERQYLLFYLTGGVELEVGDRAGGGTLVSIDPPFGGSVILVHDLVDKMLYRYGNLLGEARGEAESDQGLLPYVPLGGIAGAVAFYGHRYETGEKSVGIKIFDILNLRGEYIVRDPTFADIDLADPFASPVGYFAGFNGHASVAFAILGFGLFDFDLAEASANFDVQPLRGAAQQRLSLYANIEPDVAWQPDWMPILPATRLRATFAADAAGTLRATLAGGYRSVLPAADLRGKILIRNEGVSMQARVELPALLMPVSISFVDGETHASVDLDAEIGTYLRRSAGEVFDDVEAQLDAALDDLEAAATDYQFELSLRGLRAVIPTITAEAIARVEAIPGDVYSAVYAGVRSEINSRRYCALGICTPSDSKRDSIASSAASSARSKARVEIAPYIDAMEALRDRAAQDDDDAVREALRQALYAAYDYRHIDRTVSVTVSVDILIKTISVSDSYRINRDVLSAGQAADILAAADNIERIPAASATLVSARALVDSLPLRESLQAARADVEAGLRQLPGIAGVGYSVVDGAYSAYLAFDGGREYAVDFNVLDPAALLAGINRLGVSAVIED
ncbi:hypothetical protein [Haliea sp. E17]|uniref:hypothetical protein n=1 Tax=Haliea sp. E17 TaxID=3401576 RepID=UPI003AAA3337